MLQCTPRESTLLFPSGETYFTYIYAYLAVGQLRLPHERGTHPFLPPHTQLLYKLQFLQLYTFIQLQNSQITILVTKSFVTASIHQMVDFIFVKTQKFDSSLKLNKTRSKYSLLSQAGRNRTPQLDNSRYRLRTIANISSTSTNRQKKQTRGCLFTSAHTHTACGHTSCARPPPTIRNDEYIQAAANKLHIFTFIFTSARVHISARTHCIIFVSTSHQSVHLYTQSCVFIHPLSARKPFNSNYNITSSNIATLHKY